LARNCFAESREAYRLIVSEVGAGGAAAGLDATPPPDSAGKINRPAAEVVISPVPVARPIVTVPPALTT
jgi:hypothetical protein